MPHWAAITDREDRLTMEDGVPRRDFWGTVSFFSATLRNLDSTLQTAGGRVVRVTRICGSVRLHAPLVSIGQCNRRMGEILGDITAMLMTGWVGGWNQHALA